MLTGLYPLVPAALQARARRRPIGPELVRLRVGREWLRGVAMSAARPLSPWALPGYQRGPRPVLLVHGYAMGRSSFRWLARRLARAGLGPVIGYEYWSLGSIATAAAGLARVAELATEATGAERVDIVGHSLGGVIARYWVALAGGGEHVRRLITLGSPHAGVRISGLGLGRARRELRVGSPTLLRLARAPIPEPVAMTAIWSPDDILCGSRRHVEIPDAEIVDLSGVNHLEMLTSRRVADLVVRRLWAPV
jgi:pimeloyl-ACP methyl ester carboxylesterase